MDCSKTKEHDYEYPTMNYLEIPNTSVNDIPYIHVYFWLSISGNSSENCIVGMLLTCPINFSCHLPYRVFDWTHRVMPDYDLQVWHCPHQKKYTYNYCESTHEENNKGLELKSTCFASDLVCQNTYCIFLSIT